MDNTIPASQLVNVQPAVVGTGGTALSLNAIFLTQSPLIPAQLVVGFSTLTDVKALFGAESEEAEAAAIYFKGFKNSSIQPSLLYFAQYNMTDTSAWLRGITLGMTLAQLKAHSGSLSVVVDGTTKTAANINLSTATSFANAASIIQTALGLGVLVSYEPTLSAFGIASDSEGDGSTITFATGTLASTLGLAEGQGPTLSQGALATDPASIMDAIISQTQNWGTFTTLFEPDCDSKVAFAKWVNEQDLTYAYVMWDTDIAATQTDGETPSVGAYLTTLEYDGTIPIYSDFRIAAFVCGMAASINFTEINGRITFAYKGQSGLQPSVTNATVAKTLLANGYNFYGVYATKTETFNLFQSGQITGQWRWADSFINQIYLNSQLQAAMLNMLMNTNSVPYNQAGYDLVRSACLDPINAAKNFGAIRSGIPMSEAQIAQINQEAGRKIDDVITETGWYLQILPATAPVRGGRTSPPCKLWYTDGGSIQQLNLKSISVQ
ncbi:MAG: DUF3383 domain-containing protein [Moraxellaceae bacterium]|nr:MAG: DUF3383 domain-containing protein [Moraxellaceae bacterium]